MKGRNVLLFFSLCKKSAKVVSSDWGLSPPCAYFLVASLPPPFALFRFCLNFVIAFGSWGLTNADNGDFATVLVFVLCVCIVIIVSSLCSRLTMLSCSFLCLSCDAVWFALLCFDLDFCFCFVWIWFWWRSSFWQDVVGFLLAWSSSFIDVHCSCSGPLQQQVVVSSRLLWSVVTAAENNMLFLVLCLCLANDPWFFWEISSGWNLIRVWRFGSFGASQICERVCAEPLSL